MAAEKKRSRGRKGTANAAKEKTGNGKSKGTGETAASEGAPVPADTRFVQPMWPPLCAACLTRHLPGENSLCPGFRVARPDEPPPSLIPPDVQAELDRLIRVNRSLRAALRSLIEEE
jgi:hypothetical protein